MHRPAGRPRRGPRGPGAAVKRGPEPLRDGIQDLGRGLAQPDTVQRGQDGGFLGPMAAAARVLDRHRVRGVEDTQNIIQRVGLLLENFGFRRFVTGDALAEIVGAYGQLVSTL